MRLLSPDIIGKDEHMARVSAEAGKGGTFSIFSLFSPIYGGRPDFRESRNVHFRQLMREKGVYQWGLTRLP
jgi:hypothetical protein